MPACVSRKHKQGKVFYEGQVTAEELGALMDDCRDVDIFVETKTRQDEEDDRPNQSLKQLRTHLISSLEK